MILGFDNKSILGIDILSNLAMQLDLFIIFYPLSGVVDNK